MGTEAKRQVMVGNKSKFLAEEIIIEIMTRLPAKSLLRFKCVCKTWYNLISSPELVEKRNKKNVSLFFHHCSSWNNVGEASTNLLFRFSGLPMELTVPLFPMELTDKVKIIGCCDGVVCLSLSDLFALWNPATTQFRIIGKHCSSNMKLSNCGFCFDPVANSFKIVYVPLERGLNPNELKVNILTTRTNSWREENILVPCRIRMFDYITGTCVGRYIYWKLKSMERVHYILCFDMVNEAFNPIHELPPNLELFQLSCYKENIALIRHMTPAKHRFELVVYMMNDCQTWTHVRTIVKPHGGSNSRRGFFIMNGVDWLVVTLCDQLWMIDEETRDMQRFPWRVYPVEFYQYKESLVSF